MDGGATEIAGGGSAADLGLLERWRDDSGIAVWSFVLLGCFVLNATLLLAFLLRPGLRTISNRFVMNLTVSNLLTCAILSPLLMVDGPSIVDSTSTPQPWSAPTVGSKCAISEGVTALLSTSSVLSVLLIAIDQYFAVVDPLRYRSRIDKLKSGILILSVWVVSLIFGLLASLNPNPRSFWLSCTTVNSYNISIDAELNVTLDEGLFVVGNETSTTTAGVSTIWQLDETVESALAMAISTDESFAENATSLVETLESETQTITYGLIYALVHSVIAYLLPFAGVSWIYVRIYSAAHRNSERTRRTGSRPILSSGSFCYDAESCGTARVSQELASSDDFRRIPKISSLSSIDETSETTQPTSQVARRHSLASSNSSASEMGLPCRANDDEPTSGIVFTVGSRRVDVLPQNHSSSKKDQAEGGNNRVPVSVLKAEFLSEKKSQQDGYEDFVRSKFHDRPDQRRKSSHDLMYEEFAARKVRRESWTGGEESTSGSSESEDDTRIGDFDTLEVPKSFPSRRRGSSSRYLSPFAEYGPTIDEANESSVSVSAGVECEEPKDEKYEALIDRYHSTNCDEAQNDSQDSEAKKNAQRTKSKSLKCCFDGGSTSRRSSVEPGESNVVDSSADGNEVTKNSAENQAVESAAAALLTPIVTITPAPNKTGLHRTSSIRSTSSYINSLKYRISNGSLFKYREETRAARISALVIVMGLICWSPYVVLLLIKNLPQFAVAGIPHEFDVLALSFQLFAAYVSPLLFGYRSKRVKRELRKIFCFRRELSYKNNRSLMAKKVLKRRHSSTLSHLELDNRYNIFNCVYGRSRWPKEKVQFVQVPDTALGVETCRSSFSSGASTQISSTSTEEC